MKADTRTRTGAPDTGCKGEPAATILVVEDDGQLRRLTAMILADDQYAILEAANGREALQAAKCHSGPIDLLLTDVVMPELSGPRLAEALRPFHPETRVLYVSGYSDSRLAVHLDGSADVLLKPYLPDELLNRVRASLEGEARRARHP
jgi:DNA-binding response OmpR family regulator